MYSSGITVERRAIPLRLHRIRIGTPAITTRGFREAEAETVAAMIADLLDGPSDISTLRYVSDEVEPIKDKFPVYQAAVDMAASDCLAARPLS